MSLNLRLLRLEGSVIRESVGLWQTPTHISTEILPAREAQGLQPTKSKYIAWLATHCAGHNPNIAFAKTLQQQLTSYQATLASLREGGAGEEDTLAVQAEIDAVTANLETLTTSNVTLHVRDLDNAIAQIEAQYPNGRWVWRVA